MRSPASAGSCAGTFGAPCNVPPQSHERKAQNIWLWLSKPTGSHFGICEFTAILVGICVGIGMFTGGTIWLLTHGHMACNALIFTTARNARGPPPPPGRGWFPPRSSTWRPPPRIPEPPMQRAAPTPMQRQTNKAAAMVTLLISSGPRGPRMKLGMHARHGFLDFEGFELNLGTQSEKSSCKYLEGALSADQDAGILSESTRRVSSRPARESLEPVPTSWRAKKRQGIHLRFTTQNEPLAQKPGTMVNPEPCFKNSAGSPQFMAGLGLLTFIYPNRF